MGWVPCCNLTLKCGLSEMANVLLIEPNRLLAKTYLQALETAGHTVQVCATAQTGVFCADDTLPDVVVMELQLVGHSGIEFLYEFRSYKDWQEVPVIIATSVPAGEFTGSWQILKKELGVAAYFYKPLLSLKTLLRAVDDAVPAYA
jgi:DNA-binding response OmpR family regulator